MRPPKRGAADTFPTRPPGPNAPARNAGGNGSGGAGGRPPGSGSAIECEGLTAFRKDMTDYLDSQSEPVQALFDLLRALRISKRTYEQVTAGVERLPPRMAKVFADALNQANPALKRDHRDYLKGMPMTRTDKLAAVQVSGNLARLPKLSK